MSSSSSASANHDENFAAAASAPETSTGPGGISARMRTLGVRVSASRGKSRWTSAVMSPLPRSEAEDRCVLIADPLPEGGCAAYPSVRDQLVLVQLAGVEADRTDEQLSASVVELLECCTSDEECDGHPLAVVESGGEIDHDLG